MTEQQQTWIAQLARRCTFYPGSWDKRFVRDMARLGAYDTLSEKQSTCLEKLAWKYRGQRGEPNMVRPAGAASEPDKERLRARNEQEPIR
jgi:hypothetical protein